MLILVFLLVSSLVCAILATFGVGKDRFDLAAAAIALAVAAWITTVV